MGREVGENTKKMGLESPGAGCRGGMYLRHTHTHTHTHKGIVVDGGLFGPFITTCHWPFINAGGRILLFVTRLEGHHSGGWEDT